MSEHSKTRLELRRFIEMHPPPEAACWQLGKLLRCIHAHLFDPSLNVRELRQRCALRDNNISSRFKREMGVPPKEYIDGLRLKAAKYLLQHPDIRTAAAAHAVGYRNLQTFYRAVRRRYGCTPAALRALPRPARPVDTVPTERSEAPDCRLKDGERRTLAAAMARILPADAEWGGAGEARAIEFFDWLADQPSFKNARAELQSGLALLDSLAQALWGAAFGECGPEQQDAILRQLQEIPHAMARRFFSMLVRVTIAGFLCPPAYGGNHEETGWRFIGLDASTAPTAGAASG
jgi:AraC-like DNA-binding protein